MILLKRLRKLGRKFMIVNLSRQTDATLELVGNFRETYQDPNRIAQTLKLKLICELARHVSFTYIFHLLRLLFILTLDF